MAAVECLEQAFMPIHGLGAAEQKDPVRDKRIVERRDDGTLQFQVEIDEKVSTGQ